MKTILEVCTGSYSDCLAAWIGGAKRVELNSALALGGLTPSVTTLKRVKKDTDLKVICMVRPRAGGFCYSSDEFKEMTEEAKDLLEAGADGIAFGFIKEDKSVDVQRTKEMVNLIHDYSKEAVFHRAFDVTENPYKAIEDLIQCGVDRLLTSGQRNKATEGIPLIKELVSRYGNQIQILPGSGINSQNVRELIQKTGVSQVHSSCKGIRNDYTTCSDYVSFGYLSQEDGYDVVEEKIVAEMEKLL